jgi:CRISPR-associated protein Cst1
MAEHSIRFIGHPLIDVGVATLCADAGVDDPRDLTPEAIDAFTDRVIGLYINKNLAGFLGASVFPNARFANPNKLTPESESERREILKELLNLWKPDAAPPSRDDLPAEDESCVFSGDPAQIRVSGMYIPLMTDETKINFMPSGRPKLPLSGWCMLAILVMPMGGVVSEGRLAIAHSHDSAVTIELAATNLERNKSSMHFNSLEPRPSYIFAKSTLMDSLLYLFRKRAAVHHSIVAYLFSSSADPRRGSIEISHLNKSVLRFISRATREFEGPWTRIAQRAIWEGKDAIKTDKSGKKTVFYAGNYLYEDLWELPGNAHDFLQLYLLRRRRKTKTHEGANKNDPRYRYNTIADITLISWELTALFLKEIMNMNEKRIESIRAVADQLADYIVTRNKPKVLAKLYRVREDFEFRNILIVANYDVGGQMITYDQFVDAYFHQDEKGNWRIDWSLARDLLLIRVLEQLRNSGWFSDIDRDDLETREDDSELEDIS